MITVKVKLNENYPKFLVRNLYDSNSQLILTALPTANLLPKTHKRTWRVPLSPFSPY